MTWRLPTVVTVMLVVLSACATRSTVDDRGTIGQLRHVKPDVAEVEIDDSLNKALTSYRSFLKETPVSAKTPEAMRRLADLQIEKEYGIMGDGGVVEMPAPDRAMRSASAGEPGASTSGEGSIADLSESESDFERRTTAPNELPSAAWARGPHAGLPDGLAGVEGSGPMEAIATYQRILDEYPYYERNDQVLYQMARAYDELGEPDKAMDVMDRFIRDYRYSRYADEVFFRRAEYFFVRKQYLDAEDAYSAVVTIGPDSQFYELALYKLGWSFYKQDFYEEALHQFIALLDHKAATGFDFDRVTNIDGEISEDEAQADAESEDDAAAVSDPAVAESADTVADDGELAAAQVESEDVQRAREADDNRRVADTFRVVSLSFSNLGGPQVINEYFSSYGNRDYEDRIYSNLGEFYLTKRRYNDAAKVYRSFTELHPFHESSPHFSMRVVEIYGQGEFGQLVVEAKKDFARRYGLEAEYWQHADIEQSPDVLSYLKTNLKDLANHYHALYQEPELEEEQGEHYGEALTWYRQFLSSFPSDDDSPAINYQLADILFEHEDFWTAAAEYEHTAYEYPVHEQSAEAGYAAIYSHRQNLKQMGDAPSLEAKRATVDSTMRFVDAFGDHEQAPTVLGAATEDLYQMEDYEPAIAAGKRLIDSYPDADRALRLSAWTVVAHASFDLAQYAEAEHGYQQVLTLMPEDDEGRQGFYENLAASIYKQGEEANAAEDYRAAADHFLRVRDAAPSSEIRPAAEYDAANALMRLESWAEAGAVFRDFRDAHGDHELQPEVTKQLAFVYREAGELSRSAEEYERVAEDAVGADDPELRRSAMMTAAELFEQAEDVRALDAYVRYVDEFPEPVEEALELRFKIAGMHRDAGDDARYRDELQRIVDIDAAVAGARTPRTRYLAAQSSLVLTENLFNHFSEYRLRQPFEKSLVEKQARMDTAMSAFERLLEYEVADVTAAATFYMAEIYRNFGESLMASERPSGLTAAEMSEYEMALEGEAFPFEERAIEVHEKNLELMVAGTFNGWVQQSLGELAVLMPGRYAKAEISGGYIGPVEAYAYTTPVPAPPEGAEDVSAVY